MPQEQRSLHEGADAARSGQPTGQQRLNRQGQDLDYATKRGEQLGIPTDWVGKGGVPTFTGTVKGRMGGDLWFDASSTGGGKSDSHVIPFSTRGHNDQDFQKHFQGGKNWTATGDVQWDPQTKRDKISWSLRPTEQTGE